MKIPCCYWIAVSLMTATASAGFNVPKSIFRPAQLDEAIQEAKEKNRPLAFVYSDSASTCPITDSLTETAFKEMGRYTTMVFVESAGKEYDALQPNLKQQLNSKISGNFIPRVAVFSPDTLTAYGVVRNEDLKTGKNFRDFRKQVEGMMAGSVPPPEQNRIYLWELKGGKGYEGEFVALREGNLVLRIKGTEFALPQANFSEPTIRFAQRMAAQPAQASEASSAGSVSAAPARPAAPVMENWTSRDGRTLEARFVRLQGDQIVLIGSNGQTLQFALSLLSDESQARARKLAEP